MTGPAAPRDRPEPGDPTERLIRRTRRRLVVVAFALVATLVVGIGTVTAVLALTALDADVDRALQAAVSNAAAHPPSAESGSEGEVDDVVPAAADTFVLYLDASGGVVSNPSRIRLDGLPDPTGVAAVTAGASSDWRTIVVGGRSIRLLTVPLATGEDGGARLVQGGFVLTLHDQQSASLVTAVVETGAVGLLAAAIITAFLTRRALSPIRRAMASQRRFVADASHELRTPAAIIRADAEVLEREGHVAPEGLPLVHDIVEESARLGRLVGDLLTLATAERGELRLRVDRIDLRPLVTETARRMDALAEPRGISIVVAEGGPCPVDGDADRLAQVVVVLVDNAIGHAPDGTTVEVSLADRPGQVTLLVRDHGPGVPEADRERIFEPFTRTPSARGERRGAGLGLAIARTIVDAHRGSIAVEDAEGGGARFVVILPRAR